MADVSTYPLAGWQIGINREKQMVFIRLDFLSHKGQEPEESHQGKIYVLPPAQARELVETIQRKLHELEIVEPPDSLAV